MKTDLCDPTRTDLCDPPRKIVGEEVHGGVCVDQNAERNGSLCLLLEGRHSINKDIHNGNKPRRFK